MKLSMKTLLVAALGIVAIGMLSTCGGFEVVNTGHRGVKLTWGKVEGEPLPEGLWFYTPIASTIVELDIREQRMEGKPIAYTKDVQQVTIGFVLNYRPQEDQIHRIYAEVGTDWAQKLLPQVVESNLKNAIGQWDAVRLVENREEAVRAAEKAIREAAAERRIIVTRLEVTDLQFTEQFEGAVEAKVTAEQESARAKNRTIQIEEEAKQKIISAQAEAESMRIRANALSQNRNLVEYEAVQKWNGVLPQYILGGSVPFINVGPK